jgi:hypothetical protein
MACVLAMRGVGLSDRYDCGMYRQVVTLDHGPLIS